MEMRRRGKEVGQDNLAQNAYQQQKKNAMAKPSSRKLVILPAKPPPRKSKSVLENHNSPRDNHQESSDYNINQPRRGSRTKTAVTGVFDELNRID